MVQVMAYCLAAPGSWTNVDLISLSTLRNWPDYYWIGSGDDVDHYSVVEITHFADVKEEM